MFVLFSNEFVQNAFLAGTIVAIVAAVMGYFVVLRAQAFAGEALTDIGFAGSTAAAVFGLNPFLGMLLFSCLSALGIGSLEKRVKGRDVEIGMVLSFASGLGVLFLSLYSQMNSSQATAGLSILFGSVLSINRQQVYIALICGIILLLVLTFLYRPLLFSSIDPQVAETRGVPVRAVSLIFLVLLGITTAESVLMVGVLLVSALLIAPAAAAERLTHRPLAAIVLSITLSLTILWGGLLFTFLDTHLHLPAGFYISALASLIFFSAYFFGGRRKIKRQETIPHKHSERPHSHIAD